MKELLQNHPNWRGFPGAGNSLFGQNHPGQEKLKRFRPQLKWKLRVLFGGACVGTALLLHFYFDAYITSPSEQHSTPLFLWGMTLICLLLANAIIYRTLSGQAQQQRRYYQHAGLVPLAQSQRQALRLDIVQLYDCGFWSETLEYYPLAARVKDDDYHYNLFPLASASSYLQLLDNDWGIATAQDYHKMLQRLHNGMHSRLFAAQAVKKSEQLSQHLAELIGVTPKDVLDCLHSGSGNRPPALLWGFDLWRGIVMSRNAFSAGLIDESQAWKDLLKTADFVYEVFASFDDFYTNYRLGNAFWSNNPKIAKFRLDQFNGYKKYCRWPIAKLSWPSPSGIELSPDMLTGFGLLANKRMHQRIDRSANEMWQ
ncbi:DUF1266 domain-containing protein [Hafnia alvei]|uniref:DUF1266 domain-containing protein n=1 Tax=Hafnia alvei TaxID=569 RepID=UPI001033809A|nr:DUF1266 domain-containing protein [Hafnia alvei]TBL84990.1 DUF1266 domain-containing protein [Hafnia alvei]